jgi:hypothetical protein
MLLDVGLSKADAVGVPLYGLYNNAISHSCRNTRVLSTCGQVGVDAAIMLAMKPAIQHNTPVTDKPLSYGGFVREVRTARGVDAIRLF